MTPESTIEAMRPLWIVDDDRSIRWVLEKALARASIPCKAFGVAQDVLNELEHDSPQVLVSDIRMPGMNGIELLRAVKRMHPALPVIIMTAFSDLESAVSAFQGGAFEYLPKPFDVDKAVELIRRAVDESVRESRADESPAEVPEILGQAPSMQMKWTNAGVGKMYQRHPLVLALLAHRLDLLLRKPLPVATAPWRAVANGTAAGGAVKLTA